MSRYRTQHVATTPAGWRVRTKRAGGHLLRIAFPPGRRKKGAGQVVEVLHPKRENGCEVERKNPEQLLIFGLNNPTRTHKKRKNAAGGFGNHKPGCPCAFCQRAAKLQSGELQPPALPNRRNPKNKRASWEREARDKIAASLKRMPKPIRRVMGNEFFVSATPRHGGSLEVAGPFATRAEAKSTGASRFPSSSYFKARIAKRRPATRATARRTGPFSKYLNPKRKRRNPDDTQQAVQLYQTFHGKDPRGVVEKQEPAIMREDYAAIGPLEYLLIKSPLGETYKVEFEGDGVILASSPDGKQLYCIGGNQNLSAVLDADSLQKDFIDLGECLEVQYLARKVHSNFEPVSWHHKFGEKGGERPELIYDKLNKRIFFAGGAYFIDTSAEISPGIEN